MFSLASIIGYLGVATNTVWPFFRTRAVMLSLQALGAFLFAVHFGLLGANTAMLLMVAAGLQALVAIPLEDRPGFRRIYLATLPVIAVLMMLSWQGLASLFAALGMATISLGRYQVNLIHFRILLVGCVPFWTVHNVMVWSVPGLISDALTISTGLWGLYLAVRRDREAAEPALSAD
jgi:Bacterial inner membrane protein